MLRSALVTTLSLGLLVTASPISGNAASQEKKVKPNAPALTAKMRSKLLAAKSEQSAKKAEVRLERPGVVNPDVKDMQFAKRSVRKDSEQAELLPRLAGRTPKLAEAGKFAPFVGRRGTGWGDVYEVSAGDDPDFAQVIGDLPANVVGGIESFEDVDFYAFTATGGEYIRTEVIADRVFGTRLDSYLYLVSEAG